MASDPLDVIRSLYAAFGRRDPAAVFAAFSPQIEIVQSTELPWGGSYHGHDGARQFFSTLTGTITSTLEVERMLRSGEQVTVVGWTMGTVNATGATYRVPIAHVWTVRDGLATRAQFLIDNPTMLAALKASGAEKFSHPASTPVRRFDHVDLRVNDLKRATPFYLGLLPVLGFTARVDVPGWLQFESGGPGPAEFFGVTEDAQHVPNRSRIAFWADSDAKVDEIAARAHALGASAIEGPAFESPTYYAAYFNDPSGNPLEICHRSARF